MVYTMGNRPANDIDNNVIPAFLIIVISLGGCSNHNIIGGDTSNDNDILPTCGNGIIDEGEECEVGESVGCITECGTTGTGMCTISCQLPDAGDCVPGVEACDNGVDDDCSGEYEIFDRCDFSSQLTTIAIEGWSLADCISINGGDVHVSATTEVDLTGSDMILRQLDSHAVVQKIVGIKSYDLGLDLVMVCCPRIVAVDDAQMLISILVRERSAMIGRIMIIRTDFDLSLVEGPLLVINVNEITAPPRLLVNSGHIISLAIEHSPSGYNVLVARAIREDLSSVLTEVVHGYDEMNVHEFEAEIVNNRIVTCWVDYGGSMESVVLSTMDTDFSNFSAITLAESENMGRKCRLVPDGNSAIAVWMDGDAAVLAKIAVTEPVGEEWRRNELNEAGMSDIAIQENGGRYYVFHALNGTADGTTVAITDSTFDTIDSTIRRNDLDIVQELAEIETTSIESGFAIVGRETSGNSFWDYVLTCR